MLFVYVLLILLLIYLLFIIAPAVFSFFVVFGKKRVLKADDPALKKTLMKPYFETIRKNFEYLKDKKKNTLEIKSFDGLMLKADEYYQHSDKTVILIHGYNGDPYVHLGSQARWFYDKGYNVLLLYQRAHGVSEGKNCAFGLLEKNDL